MRTLNKALGYDKLIKAEDMLSEFLSEGKAAEMGVKFSDVDPEQLWMGTEIEMEHTLDKRIARKIALDHLAEFPNYYTALIEMEKRLKEGNSSGADAGSEDSGSDSDASDEAST